MFVKFFSRPVKRDGSKGGSPKRSMNYLLDKPEEQVKVLAGNPELSKELAEGLLFENKYTVGCLTFEEPNIPEKQKYEIIQRFEETFFAGLESNQYNISWVEHTDKGRLELNFFIPNIELSTGKRLQPYYDRADKHLAEGFKQVINLQYGLSSPDDPQKRQTVMINKNLPKTSKATVGAINELIRDGFENGEVSNRQEVIQFLEKYGFEIARQTEKFISIKNENGRNIRLKGAFYEQSFGIGGKSQEAERARKAGKEGIGSLTSQDGDRELYQRAEAALAKSVEKRKEVFSKLFEKGKTGPSGGSGGVTEASREFTQGFGQEIQNTVLGASGVSSDDGDRVVLSDVGSKETIQPDGGLEAVGRAIQNSQQRDGHSELQNIRQHSQNMREDRPELSRPSMGRQYENYSEKGGINGPSYEALKGSIVRFRREAEQRVEAIKREIKQATEFYRSIAGRKPTITELAQGVVRKFRLKLQKQAHEKKEKEQTQSRGMRM